MTSKLVPAAFAALAVAALTIASTGSLSAFTLSAPSLEPEASAPAIPVWWDRWGRWHPNAPWGWRRWGWGPRPYGFYPYYGPVRRCWVGPWGGVRCRWV